MNNIELKEARKKLGFTIKRMSEELNTPKRTYEHWENGTRRVPGIAKIALEFIKR